MKATRRWNAAEICLLLAPLLFLLCALLFFAFKRANAPHFVTSQYPVARAYFVGENRLLSVEVPHTAPGAPPALPVLNLYERESGARLSQRTWPQSVTHVEVSPNADWLLVFEGRYGVKSTFSLVRTDGLFTTYQTGDIGNWTQLRWVSDSVFLIQEAPGAAAPRQNRRFAIQDDSLELIGFSPLFQVSPDKKWRIEAEASRMIETPMRFVRNLDENANLWTQRDVLKPGNGSGAAFPLGDNFTTWNWSDNGREAIALRSVSASPRRMDFVRLDPATRQKTALRIAPDIIQEQFWLNFALDNRICVSHSQWSYRFVDTKNGELLREIAHEKNTPGTTHIFRGFGLPSLSKNRRFFARPVKNGVEIYDLERWLR